MVGAEDQSICSGRGADPAILQRFLEDFPGATVVRVQTNYRSTQTILDAAGARFADVLKVTVYLTDVEDRKKINPLRQAFFGDARPASTLIGVQALAIPGMKVEIEAVVGLRA